jgi:hypothetical protein
LIVACKKNLKTTIKQKLAICLGTYSSTKSVTGFQQETLPAFRLQKDGAHQPCDAAANDEGLRVE